MIKRGFTLAEVLVTLGIIGVVAAMTLPILTNSTQNAQVGPKLAKAVSMFEQANMAMINENAVSSLISMAPVLTNENYFSYIKRHMRVSSVDAREETDIKYELAPDSGGTCVSAGTLVAPHETTCNLMSKDGVRYDVHIAAADARLSTASYPHKQHFGTVFIDITGNAGPNAIGKDIFAFIWYANGSLRPVCGSNAVEDSTAIDCHWKDLCPKAIGITNGYACAGHIFENGLKAEY